VARKWHKEYMSQFLNPQQLVNQLKITQGMKIADFGCGSGNITVVLGRLVGQTGEVIAIDIQTAKLESVKSRAQLENLNNIRLVRANLEKINSSKLADNSVDLVLLANILFQSPNQKAVIQEAERVVKKNGRMVVVDWQPGAKIGPETPFRTTPQKIKQMVGLKFEKEIPAGQYHFGLIFKK